MTLNRASSVCGIDAHALDGARRGALAATDLRALERRARRARAGEQPLAIAQHDLRVGAHVDEQSQLIAEVGTLRENHARGIRADVSGNTRQHIDARVGMEVQSDLRGPDGQRAIGRQRKRARRPARPDRSPAAGDA